MVSTNSGECGALYTAQKLTSQSNPVALCLALCVSTPNRNGAHLLAQSINQKCQRAETTSPRVTHTNCTLNVWNYVNIVSYATSKPNRIYKIYNRILCDIFWHSLWLMGFARLSEALNLMSRVRAIFDCGKHERADSICLCVCTRSIMCRPACTLRKCSCMP